MTVVHVRGCAEIFPIQEELPVKLWKGITCGKSRAEYVLRLKYLSLSQVRHSCAGCS